MHTNTTVLEAAGKDSTISLREIRESEHFYRQLVDGLAAAVYTCDAQGYIRSYNKAAAELWGREPVIGHDLWCGSWKIFRPEDGSPLPLDNCPMARALKNKVSVRNEEIIVERPDGIRKNILPHPDPIFDTAGNLAGAVNLLMDITELKQKEKALRDFAHEMELRVEDRTKELKEANNALQHTNAELEQFAFVASHDMQEPLRKINTFATRLEKKSEASWDEEDKVFLRKIKKSANRMSGLINDVLKFSRVGFFKEEFVDTDLNAVLENELGDFELAIEQKQAQIHSEPLPTIKAIPHLMGHLFRNIISNSLKFCRDGVPCQLHITSRMLTQAECEARALAQKFNYCEITFRDNGIGFQQEYASNIFRIFERLNGRDQYEGTGIGLALCSKIAAIHHGQIFARSTVNEGTVIHVILPLDLT